MENLLEWRYPNKSLDVFFLLENPTEMDEIWGYPYFRTPPYDVNDGL